MPDLRWLREKRGLPCSTPFVGGMGKLRPESANCWHRPEPKHIWIRWSTRPTSGKRERERESKHRCPKESLSHAANETHAKGTFFVFFFLALMSCFPLKPSKMSKNKCQEKEKNKKSPRRTAKPIGAGHQGFGALENLANNLQPAASINDTRQICSAGAFAVSKLLGGAS